MSEGAAAVGDGVTAGLLLRRAREEAGLHVAALAVSLKVPARKLEALEEDRYDLLSDAVFVRGLASSVCRTLKIDPQPVLERLPQTAAPRLVQDGEGINAPFRAPGDSNRPRWLEHVSRPVVLSVIMLLLAALVLIFLPTTKPDINLAKGRAEPAMPPGTPAVVTAPAAESRPQPVSTGETAGVAAVAPAGDAASQKPAASPEAAASRALSNPVAASAAPVTAVALSTGPSTTAATAQAAPASAAASPLPAKGLIVFRTRAPSWVEVIDAKGNTVLRRLLESGESAGVTGALPLSVVVGSAESTDVQVRGRRFDLAPVSRDNVARFEVK